MKKDNILRTYNTYDNKEEKYMLLFYNRFIKTKYKTKQYQDTVLIDYKNIDTKSLIHIVNVLQEEIEERKENKTL